MLEVKLCCASCTQAVALHLHSTSVLHSTCSAHKTYPRPRSICALSKPALLQGRGRFSPCPLSVLSLRPHLINMFSKSLSTVALKRSENLLAGKTLSRPQVAQPRLPPLVLARSQEGTAQLQAEGCPVSVGAPGGFPVTPSRSCFSRTAEELHVVS